MSAPQSGVRVRALTVEEREAAAQLTAAWQSAAALSVRPMLVHSLFVLGVAERTPVLDGARWVHHYRRMPSRMSAAPLSEGVRCE